MSSAASILRSSIKPSPAAPRDDAISSEALASPSALMMLASFFCSSCESKSHSSDNRSSTEVLKFCAGVQIFKPPKQFNF